VDSIRMDLQEVGCGYMDWIGLAQDRDRWRTLVSAVMNLRVRGNALSSQKTCCNPCVRVIKWRRIRWVGHVARMDEERGVYRVLVGKPEGRNHWGDLGIDGCIILACICRRCDWVYGLDWAGPR
jgi:hypothetical protein